MGFSFFLDNLLLGAGLAMDAFSVSVANGLHDPAMPGRSRLKIAGVFAFFQFLMPVLGWLGVRGIASVFSAFEKAVPWIALLSTLLLQGVATSIDALSAGFALASYTFAETLISGLIIAAVTLFLCLVGVWTGQKAGQRLTRWASVLGGLILIGIGIEIFLKNTVFS